MNIRCPAANTIQQYLVHILDDGRIVHVRGGNNAFVFLVTTFGLNTLQIGIVKIPHGIVMGFEVLVDGHPQGRIIHQNGIGTQAGVELDLIQGLDVGGVGNRNKQPVAPFIEGQGIVLAHQLLVHQLLRQHLRQEAVQVQHADAKLHGCRKGQLPAVRQVVLNQVGDQGNAVFGRLKVGVFCHSLFKQAIFHKTPGQPGKRYIALVGCHR